MQRGTQKYNRSVLVTRHQMPAFRTKRAPPSEIDRATLLTVLFARVCMTDSVRVAHRARSQTRTAAKGARQTLARVTTKAERKHKPVFQSNPYAFAGSAPPS